MTSEASHCHVRQFGVSAVMPPPAGCMRVVGAQDAGYLSLRMGPYWIGLQGSDSAPHASSLGAAVVAYEASSLDAQICLAVCATTGVFHL